RNLIWEHDIKFAPAVVQQRGLSVSLLQCGHLMVIVTKRDSLSHAFPSTQSVAARRDFIEPSGAVFRPDASKWIGNPEFCRGELKNALTGKAHLRILFFDGYHSNSSHPVCPAKRDGHGCTRAHGRQPGTEAWQ